MEAASKERRVADVLSRFGFAAGTSDGADFERPNQVLNVKGSLRSLRDLHGGAVQLAQLGQADDVKNACLLVLDHALSPERLEHEWRAVLRLLRPEVASKLSLIALSNGAVVAVPDARELRSIGEAVAADLAASGSSHARSGTFYEVVKLLILHWLRQSGPLRIQELQAQAGLSYPTVARALQRLGGHVRRRSDRRVELGSFPQEAWNELLALAPRVRGSVYFWDRSAQRESAEDLLARVSRLRLAGVAVGGVHAARHWDPELDLTGAPRLDLCVQADEGRVNLAFVRKVDPALESVAPHERRLPALAVHVLHRPVSFFEGADGAPFWADPVETLLDLHDLRLAPQAEEMVRRLRRKK